MIFRLMVSCLMMACAMTSRVMLQPSVITHRPSTRRIRGGSEIARSERPDAQVAGSPDLGTMGDPVPHADAERRNRDDAACTRVVG